MSDRETVPTVRVYTGKHCLPCDQVKAWLTDAGVAFEERDVMTDDAAYDELMALGIRRVPVTIIGDDVLQGFDPDALARHTRHLRPTAETAATSVAPSE